MFTGFTDETVDFMWGIRFNNERPWFEEHKEQYLRSFLQPMRELEAELFDFVRAKRPDHALMGRVSRIYRDARRLYGRGPYKDHLWMSIERPGDLWDPRPALWFELGPDGWGYGLGYWNAPPVVMMKLRARLDRDPAPMEALMRDFDAQSEFTLWSEDYKRPKGSNPSPLLDPWYRRKRFSFQHEEKLTEELFSRDILERLKKGYEFLLPWYDYLIALDGDPDPREM